MEALLDRKGQKLGKLTKGRRKKPKQGPMPEVERQEQERKGNKKDAEERRE